MSQSNNVCSVDEYFQKGIFIIPNYQRGYKWGVPSITKENNEGKEAVGTLMNSLLNAFKQNKQEYFLQGITVVENNPEITLIDGQQRTTTLFILLSFLNSKIGHLERLINREDNKIAIQYNIRAESHKFLKELSSPDYIIVDPDAQNDSQDVYYFKKALNTINNSWLNFVEQAKNEFEKRFNEEQKETTEYTTALLKMHNDNGTALITSFKDFLLNKVKMLYITIKPEKATTIFKMMNGQKAEMKVEELIKSAILSQSSRVTKPIEAKGNDINALLQVVKEKVGEEWEINSLRSKYAREWDKWLYWWNRKDVSEYFGTNRSPLGLLLEYFYSIKSGKNNYSQNKRSVGETFDTFKSEFLKDPKEAKLNFNEIRRLQKRFEDWYEKPLIYNAIGFILKLAGDQKRQVLMHLIKEKLSYEDLMHIGKYLAVGATLKEIIEESQELHDKSTGILNILNEEDVYNERNIEGEKDNRKEMAFRQLLRRNIEMDNDLNRKFDFSIWNDRSLEHVHPKSKVYKIDSYGNTVRCTNNKICDITKGNYINKADFEEGYSEHCIGNLFLLIGKDNSSFNDSDFADKKNILFAMQKAGDKNSKLKESIKLLHTTSAFAERDWDISIIKRRKDEFIDTFCSAYSIPNPKKN